MLLKPPQIELVFPRPVEMLAALRLELGPLVKVGKKLEMQECSGDRGKVCWGRLHVVRAADVPVTTLPFDQGDLADRRRKKRGVGVPEHARTGTSPQLEAREPG